MRAILCSDFNSPLTLEQVDDPIISADDIRVKVAASGVNFVDALIVSGKYQLKPALPYIPGFEVAGTVDMVGQNVSGFEIGERVFATSGLSGGGYAERVAVNARNVFKLAETMTFGQGATFVQSYCTALFALTKRIQLAPGQTLLVLGASGGVGRAAVDVAKALGATVIAAASSAQRLQTLAELAPDAVINYTSEDLKTRARELSGGGVDAVYDPLGGDYSEHSLRALTDDGSLLIIGFAAGHIPRLPSNQVLLHNRRIVGVDWGGWRSAKPDSQRELMVRLGNMLSSGKLKPQEPTAWPLASAAQALDAVNTRQVIGKLVLHP